MNKQTEALKLALEALEDYVEEYGPHEKDSGAAYAITAIREALAEQPAQQLEPVGEVFGYYERGFTEQKTLYGKLHNQNLPVGAKLYTSPPASKPMPEDYTALEQALTRLQKRYADLEGRASKPWVGLTEFDIDQIPYSCSHADSRLIAYATEAKLREKNNG